MTMIDHKMNAGCGAAPYPSGTRRRSTAPYGSGIGIKELAERLGTTQRALRYYEQVDLIRPDRNAQGARNYGPGTRRELELVVTLRRTGHSLKEIRAILSGEDQNDDAVQLKVAVALRNRLDQLEDQVDQMKRLLARFGGSREVPPGPTEGSPRPGRFTDSGDGPRHDLSGGRSVRPR